MFEQIDYAQALVIVFEPAEISHQVVEGAFPGVPERRMPQVVRQAYRLGEGFVEPEQLCNRPGDLCDLDAVGQTRAVVIIEARCEYLGLAFQAAKCGAVNYTVAVSFEI